MQCCTSQECRFHPAASALRLRSVVSLTHAAACHSMGHDMNTKGLVSRTDVPGNAAYAIGLGVQCVARTRVTRALLAGYGSPPQPLVAPRSVTLACLSSTHHRPHVIIAVRVVKSSARCKLRKMQSRETRSWTKITMMSGLQLLPSSSFDQAIECDDG